jgi:hypothetical protein
MENPSESILWQAQVNGFGNEIHESGLAVNIVKEGAKVEMGKKTPTQSIIDQAQWMQDNNMEQDIIATEP